MCVCVPCDSQVHVMCWMWLTRVWIIISWTLTHVVWVDALCNYKHTDDSQLRPKHVGAVKWKNIYLIVYCVGCFL